MRAILRNRILGAALAVASLAGCAARAPVTRMVDGHHVEGRYVADRAYAAYLRGVTLEAKGELAAARAAYDEALGEDPESAELWTRLGAISCTGARSDGGAALRAFDRAVRIDPEYEEAWTERARCHLAREELEQALGAARTAVSLDPDRREPVLLLVKVLGRLSRASEARAWLDGLVIRDPGSAAALGDLDSNKNGSRADPLAQTLGEVDGALLRGNDGLARRRALAARLSSGQLAVRAAALGRASFAREQAAIVLGADPGDTDARVAAAVAADLARDDAALARALASLPDGSTPLSPLARALLAELVTRRVGVEARTAWPNAPEGAVTDPLLRAVENRR
jgi:tetratricopeptide (TPR) repeat protein